MTKQTQTMLNQPAQVLVERWLKYLTAQFKVAWYSILFKNTSHQVCCRKQQIQKKLYSILPPIFYSFLDLILVQIFENPTAAPENGDPSWDDTFKYRHKRSDIEINDTLTDVKTWNRPQFGRLRSFRLYANARWNATLSFHVFFFQAGSLIFVFSSFSDFIFDSLKHFAKIDLYNCCGKYSQSNVLFATIYGTDNQSQNIFPSGQTSLSFTWVLSPIYNSLIPVFIFFMIGHCAQIQYNTRLYSLLKKKRDKSFNNWGQITHR